jgi:WD40 repeat protein
MPDVMMDPARLPPGVVAQIGQPRFAQGEVLQSLTERADGSVFGYAYRYVRIWDGTTGMTRWSMQTQTPSLEAAVARSADVVVTSEAHTSILMVDTVNVINTRTGERLLTKDYNDVFAVAVSSNGRHVLLMASTLGLRDMVTGEEPSPPTRVIAIAGLVRDDRSVVAVERDRVVRWDGTKAGAVETVATLPARPRVVAFDAAGTRVAWALGDRFGLVDIASGAALMDVTKPGLAFKSLAVSPDGRRVATGTADRVIMWEAGKDAPSWEYPIRYMDKIPIAFLGNGDVITGELSRMIRLSPAGQPRPQPPIVELEGFAVDGTLVLDIDGKDTGFDLTKKREVPAGPLQREHVPKGIPAWADEAVLATDGSMTAWSAAAMECAKVRVWRSRGGTWTSGKPRSCTESVLTPWIVGPGMLADVSEDSPVVWDVASGKQVLEIPSAGRKFDDLVGVPDQDHVVVVFFQPDHVYQDDPYRGQQFKMGFYVELWSRKSGKPLVGIHVPPERMGLLYPVASRDGSTVYFGWKDGTVDALDVRSGKLRALGRHPSGIRSVEESPLGGLLATVDDEGRAFLWQPHAGAGAPR